MDDSKKNEEQEKNIFRNTRDRLVRKIKKYQRLEENLRKIGKDEEATEKKNDIEQLKKTLRDMRNTSLKSETKKRGSMVIKRNEDAEKRQEELKKIIRDPNSSDEEKAEAIEELNRLKKLVKDRTRKRLSREGSLTTNNIDKINTAAEILMGMSRKNTSSGKKSKKQKRSKKKRKLKKKVTRKR